MLGRRYPNEIIELSAAKTCPVQT